MAYLRCFIIKTVFDENSRKQIVRAKAWDLKKFIECMAEISYEYIKITGDLGYFGISERVNVTLNSLPIITLSDHIAFAIECKKIYQSSYLPNIRLFFRRACPRTVLFGEIKEKFGVEFNGNKAGFIAMHIINARMGTNMGQIPYITKTINGCMEITDTFYLFGKN